MISGDIFGALNGLVSGRCYPGTFPQPTPPASPIWPAIRYQVISVDPVQDICGTDVGETDRVEVQIDYVAKTYGAALTLRDQGRAALLLVTPPCVRGSGFETFDSETKTHRISDDYFFDPSSEASS